LDILASSIDGGRPALPVSGGNYPKFQVPSWQGTIEKL